MGVKLTEHQLQTLKHTVRMSEAFANSLLHIMQNHGLDKVDGCDITIQVNPNYESICREISIGNFDTDFGFAQFIRGKNDAEYHLWTGRHSGEYERVFAEEAIQAGIDPFPKAEKPLPPDGLWIGDPRNDCPVGDRWEWDVNDSLS